MQDIISENVQSTSTCKHYLCSTSTTTTFVNNKSKTLDFGTVKIPLVYANLFLRIFYRLPDRLDRMWACLFGWTPWRRRTDLQMQRRLVCPRGLLWTATLCTRFSCFMLRCVFFGFALFMVKVFQPHLTGKTERNFPQRFLFLVGALGSIGGLLLVFASSGTRTAPYLQAILLNFLIPMTVMVRWVIRLWFIL